MKGSVALTHAHVDSLEVHLSRRFKCSVHRKADSAVMSAAGDLLGVADLLRGVGLELGLPTSESWPRYGTTLGPFVFMPDIDDPQERSCILVHEVSHGWDARRQGFVKYGELYLREREFRAASETGPYCAEQELRHAFTGVVPPLKAVVRIDHGYGLDARSIEFAELLTEQGVTAMAAGVYTQPVAREAQAFLRGLGVLA